MNKKGITIIGAFFYILVFLFLWGIFLSKYLVIIGTVAVESMGATGIMAFTLMNLNLVVLVGVVLWILLAGYLS